MIGKDDTLRLFDRYESWWIGRYARRTVDWQMVNKHETVWIGKSVTYEI